MFKIAEAEPVLPGEGNTRGTDMRGVAALPGSMVISRSKGLHRNLERPYLPDICPDHRGIWHNRWRGTEARGNPEPTSEARWGDELGRSTDDGGEGNEPSRGKALTCEELGRDG